MRKRVALLIVCCLVVTALMPPTGGAASAPERWWTTRGRTPEHGNTVVEPFGQLELGWTLDGLGMTATQPLFVDGVVYHLSRGGLFRVSFNPNGEPQKETLFDASINTFSDGSAGSPVAGMTYAEEGGRRILYFATASNKICAYDLATSSEAWKQEEHCKQVSGQIVSAPLVFGEQDMVLVGDKAGILWAVRGLSIPGTHLRDLHQLTVEGASTWITSSAVRVPDTPSDFIFSAYVPGGKALVGRGRVTVKVDGKPDIQVLDTQGEESGLWTTSLESRRGMADGFLLDPGTNSVFMSDLKGRMFRQDVSRRDGKIAVDPPGPRFANDMPAISQDGRTVYFTMRAVNPDNPDNPNSDIPGSVIAVDKGSWSIKWEQFLEQKMGAANTPPLVWGDAIVVGTAQGYIVGLDRGYDRNVDAGDHKLVPITTGLGERFPGSDEKQLRPLLPGETPNRAEWGFSSLSGAGVQPIVSSGGGQTTYLIMGVNYCNEVHSDCSGRLMGFRARLDDPAVSTLLCPANPKEWFDAKAVVSYQTGRTDTAFTGSLAWTWSLSPGELGGETKQVSLQPNSSKVLTQTVQGSSESAVAVTLTARLILPEGFKDANTNNNVKTCTVTIQPCPACHEVPDDGEGGPRLYDPDS